MNSKAYASQKIKTQKIIDSIHLHYNVFEETRITALHGEMESEPMWFMRFEIGRYRQHWGGRELRLIDFRV